MKNLNKNLVLGILVLLLGTFSLQSCDKEESRSNNLIGAGNIEDAALVGKVWWKNSDGNHTVNVTDQVSYSPSKSLMISRQNQDPNTFAFWAQTITSNIPIGKAVTLRVKVKGNLTGSGVGLAIRGDDTQTASGAGEQFITTQGTQLISGNFDWTEYSVTLDSVNPDIKSLTIYLIHLKNASGEVYFDDISLTF